MINERTDGVVTITVHPTGVITAPDKVFESVQAGLIDLGHHTPAYTPGVFAAGEALQNPLPAKNAYSFSHMATDFYAKYWDTMPEMTGVRFLFCGTPGPYVLAAIDSPITTLADMKGLKMRALGGAVDLVTNWGGTPVSMPMGDVYEGLSKGVLDGGVLPYEAIDGFKFYDHVKYTTPAPVGLSFPGFISMNMDSWNSLPADIQAVFNETTEEMIEWYASAWQYGDIVGIESFLSQGGTIHEIPAGEQQEWIDLAKPVTEKYIADKTAMGYPAAEYVDYFWERGEYWNNNYPGDDVIRAWAEGAIGQ